MDKETIYIYVAMATLGLVISFFGVWYALENNHRLDESQAKIDVLEQALKSGEFELLQGNITKANIMTTSCGFAVCPKNTFYIKGDYCYCVGLK